MNLIEAINSDDIEIATLAAAILRQERGKTFVANLVKKNGKYEFKKGQGLVKVHTWDFSNAWNQSKMVNTPLLNMHQFPNIHVNGTVGEISFTMPYKIDTNETK